jgi:hypothetical protein
LLRELPNPEFAAVKLQEICVNNVSSEGWVSTKLKIP